MADLAPHEAIELHELISSSISEIKNISSNLPEIKDDDLRKYADKYMDAKKNNLEEIQKTIDSINKK